MVVITDGGDTVQQIRLSRRGASAQEAEAIVTVIIVVPVEASAGTRHRPESMRSSSSPKIPAAVLLRQLPPQLDGAFRQISDPRDQLAPRHSVADVGHGAQDDRAVIN